MFKIGYVFKFTGTMPIRHKRYFLISFILYALTGRFVKSFVLVIQSCNGLFAYGPPALLKSMTIKQSLKKENMFMHYINQWCS